jgi:hypothetical protein
VYVFLNILFVTHYCGLLSDIDLLCCFISFAYIYWMHIHFTWLISIKCSNVLIVLCLKYSQKLFLTCLQLIKRIGCLFVHHSALRLFASNLLCHHSGTRTRNYRNIDNIDEGDPSKSIKSTKIYENCRFSLCMRIMDKCNTCVISVIHETLPH